MATRPHRAFTAALESLPSSYRQLLALHELDGATTEGISHLLGLTPAQTRITLQHARRAMRLRLTERMRPVV